MSVRLDAEGVTVRRGGRQVRGGVSLSALPGEVLAVVGPNGAGKSTLPAVLAGDLHPDAGRVLAGGEPLRRLGARRRARLRAVLAQQHAMEFPFRGREVVAMGRAPHAGLRSGRDPAGAVIVAAALRAADAEDLADRSVAAMSVGERSRIAFARVLAQDCPVVLLDEPTAALDLRHQQVVMATARRLAAEGRVVVAVVHDLSLAATHADRVAVVCGGRLVVCARPGIALAGPLLERVFGLPVQVLRHPVSGRPLVIPGASAGIGSEPGGRLGEQADRA